MPASLDAPCSCRFRQLAPDHHDRMRGIETQALDAITELVELAATWHELEYGEGEPLLGPEHWLGFVDAHPWNDAERVFELVLGLVSLSRRPQRSRRLAAV